MAPLAVKSVSIRVHPWLKLVSALPLEQGGRINHETHEMLETQVPATSIQPANSSGAAAPPDHPGLADQVAVRLWFACAEGIRQATSSLCWSVNQCKSAFEFILTAPIYALGKVLSMPGFVALN